MKKYCLLFCLFGLIFFVNAQPIIKLTTGNVINENSNHNPTNNIGLFEDAFFNNKYYLFIQFNNLPTESNKIKLEELGVQLFNYYPDNTYFASFPVSFDYKLLKQFNVLGICKFNWYYKIDNSLYSPTSIPWANSNDGKLKTVVSFAKVLPKENFKLQLKNIFPNLLFSTSLLSNAIEVIGSIEEIKKIAKHPIVQFIEPIGSPAEVEDLQGISNHRNNTTFTTDNYFNGKKYNGNGITIVMGDDGFVGPHIDFTGRLENRATNLNASDTHGDHVMGIIGGVNNFNSTVRGQAPGAKLITYDNYADYNEFPNLYTVDSARVTSHSLGQTCNSGYTSDARTSDQLINLYPLINHVHSSGNSGNSSCGGLTGGWATITGGFKSGKNAIAVGNLLKDDMLSSSSSKGPTRDGRIKPDIVAVGTSINSTQPNNTYASNSGTSMACPAIAGSLAVLAQVHKQKFGTEAPGALLKAIMMNTADDLGNAGPDFSFGFGRVNLRRAVDCIENSRFRTGNISQGLTNTEIIAVPNNVASIKVMVYWNDFAGSAGSLNPLVNNINTTITSPSMLIFEPWLMSAGSPINAGDASNPAIKGNDNLNNVEQIQIDNPVAGNYTLNIIGQSIPQGPQTYYVVIEYLFNNNVVVTYPFGGETFLPGEVQRIRWDATATESDFFNIDYSLNNGSTWINIATFLSGSLRHVDWTTPSSTSSNALIKVTKNNDASDVSDTTFVILGRPTNLQFTEVCNGRSTISWNAVSGATGYDVFLLGEKFMQQVASTTNTNATISNLGFSENWFSVRARMALRGAAGLRTNAVAHTNNSVVACPPMPVKLTNFYGIINNGKPNLFWNVALEENMIAYEIERSSSPNFENIMVVATTKPKNKGLLSVDYEVVDNERLAEGTYYYRLKMIEVDKSTFSKVVPINLTSKIKTAFSLFPNPTLSDVYITNASDVVVNINIYNMQGQLLQTQNKASLQKNLGFRIGVNNLSSGIYSLVLINEKTGEVIGKQLFNKQ